MMSVIKAIISGILQTGQHTCHDNKGNTIECTDSGQDAEFHSGLVWPSPRFTIDTDIVRDKLTGLCWPVNASLSEFPLNWNQALQFVADMKATATLGYHDWRLPNRRELRSLICHQSRQPALPVDHPFHNVFPHWYWSSTSVAAHPGHAWYVNMAGGRMFYGGKDQAFMLWPVRGSGNMLPRTGQRDCYNCNDKSVDGRRNGQDGACQSGHEWPVPRFETAGAHVHDRLTGLLWHAQTRLTSTPVTWCNALQTIVRLNESAGSRHWRLPNINELESLIDCSQHSPALPTTHPFISMGKIYWSSTTSLYEPDWAWALYLDDGAVGVGQKDFAHFDVWAVSDAAKGR
jgi:hypothetical protein